MVEGLAPSWAQPRCSGGPEENYRTSVRQARSSRIARRLTPPSRCDPFPAGQAARPAPADRRRPRWTRHSRSPAARRFVLPLRSSPARWPAGCPFPVPRIRRRCRERSARAGRRLRSRRPARRCRSIEKDGRHYIVGMPGHEYAVRIRNTTGARILVVTSVDGVNVVTGDTAAPSQSGLRDRPVGQCRDRRLAQEHVAHRRVLLHRALEQLRGAHRPSARRRRHRRRGVRRKSGAASDAHQRVRPRTRGPMHVARRRPKPMQQRRRRAAPPMPSSPATRRCRAASRKANATRPSRASALRTPNRWRSSAPGTGATRRRTCDRSRSSARPAIRRRSSRSSTTAARTWSRWACCPRRRITMRAVRRSRSPACDSCPIRGRSRDGGAVPRPAHCGDARVGPHTSRAMPARSTVGRRFRTTNPTRT